MKRELCVISVLISLLSMFHPPHHAFADKLSGQRFQRSFQYEDQGKISFALNEIIKILQTNPNNYTANLRAAWLYYLRGYYDDSITQYRKAINLRPRAIEPIQGIMLPLMKSKRWGEALAVGLPALKTDRNNYLVKRRLAYCLYSMQKFDQAAKFYREILELYPSDTELQLELGWCYTKMGKPKPARKLFSSVLGVMPFNTSALAGMQATRPTYGAVRAYR